jgi:hypothetical protein
VHSTCIRVGAQCVQSPGELLGLTAVGVDCCKVLGAVLTLVGYVDAVNFS